MTTPQEMRSESRPYHTDVRWFHRETVTDATSEPLVLPSLGRDVSIAVNPGTDALVQYTLSSYADIEGDTAIWNDWPSGTVTSATADGVASGVSALRLVSTGVSEWEVAI